MFYCFQSGGVVKWSLALPWKTRRAAKLSSTLSSLVPSPFLENDHVGQQAFLLRRVKGILNI